MAEDFYSCFISYRHPAAQGNREERMIRNVVKAISDHIQVYTHDHKIFFDEDRLVPGYQYNQRLAEAMCRSACMVIVYWPSYLESDYCQREIATMLSIERKRRDVLGGDLVGSRLFIPVILRGNYSELPEEVTKDCHYLDYKAQAVRPDFNMGDDERTSDKLYDIAEYVHSLCGLMKKQGDGLFGHCRGHQLAAPASVAIHPAQEMPFPGR